MREKLREIIENTVGSEAGFDLMVPEHLEQGHYSTNLAMRYAKFVRQNPMSVAADFVGRIKSSAPENYFEKIEVAPPGFINFWLKSEIWQEGITKILEGGNKYGETDIGHKKTVIVEHSSLNIAKPIHVGHLRNAFIGDVLANLYAITNHKVVRWNYLGDWGTQFGKLIVAYRKWGKKETVEKDPIPALTALYVRFHEEVKNDEKLGDEARAEFRKLEEGDRENRRLWSWFKKESLREFHHTYKTLNISFDTDIGESFFEKDLPGVISELTEKGLARESEGSLIVDLQKFNLPVALVRKSDGSSLYLTRDIANLKYRLKEYSPARVLYVVGNEQSLHLSQVFAIFNLLELGGGVDLMHVKYGMVLGESGKKFSTREGHIISAEEVLQKALGLARGIVQDKNPDLSRREQEDVARAVAVGALKYTNLKENRNSDIVFDWQKMLDFSGDSGPYLQYTHARLKSILRKAGRLNSYWPRRRLDLLSNEKELNLMRAITEYPHAILSALEDAAPNLVCSYLYELANAINGFYESCPVIKEENSDLR
ncbi:MAG: arginine--tRNA ligase, partial [Candidatus Liptonbacteria bacterium]